MSSGIWSLLDGLVFGAAEEHAGPGGAVLRVLRYPYAVVRDLTRGEINLRAMGLVYTTLLSLIPLLVFSFAILNVFGARHDLGPVLYEFFRPLGARGAAQLTGAVMQFATRASGLVGSVGFAVLAWTLLGTIKRVEDSLNFLWRVEQPRRLARRLAEYLTLLVVGPLLLVAFLGLMHAAFASAPLQEVAQLPLLRRIPGIALALAPYVMVSAVFAAMYRFIPNTAVRWRAALVGALVAGVLWAAVGRAFTALVVYSSRLTLLYAGFAAFAAALLWTYSGWLILLAGAQLSFYIQNPSYLRLGLAELRLSAAELEELSLKLMYFIGRTHLAGGPRWTVERLAGTLGLPALAVARMSGTLQSAGLLLASEHGELLPARDIGQIRLLEILEVARNERSGHADPRPPRIPVLDELLAGLDEVRRARCANTSLRELVEAVPVALVSSAGARPGRRA